MKRLIILALAAASLISLAVYKGHAEGLIGDVLSIPGRAVEATGQVLAETGRAISGRPYYYGYQRPYYDGPYYDEQPYFSGSYYKRGFARPYYYQNAYGVRPSVVQRRVITNPEFAPYPYQARRYGTAANCQQYLYQLNNEFNNIPSTNQMDTLNSLKNEVESYINSDEYAQYCPSVVRQQFQDLQAKINNAISQSMMRSATMAY